jgi:hypothetical protein
MVNQILTVIGSALLVVGIMASLVAKRPPQSATQVATEPNVHHASPVTRGTAAIHGHVNTARGIPITRAALRLYSPSMGDVSTVTNRRGEYEFNSLVPGQYTLSAAKAGYVAAYYGQRRAFEPMTTLEIATGQLVEDINIALERGSAVSGRVVDEVGEPVGNAFVNALRVAEVLDQNRPLQRAPNQEGIPAPPPLQARGVRTDDNGRFRLYGLAAGAYYVAAKSDELPGAFQGNSQSRIDLPVYFPQSRDTDGAKVVHVVSGSVVNLTITVAPVPVVRVSGVVFTSNGEPATTGIVRIVRRNTFRAPLPGGVATIQPNGAFAITPMSNGAYVLYASSGSAWARPGIQRDIEVGTATIMVASRDVSDIHISTKPGGVVSGQVLNPIGGPTLDLRTLRVFPVTPDPDAASVLGSAAVQEDGTFELRNLFGRSVLSIGAQSGFVWSSGLFINGQDIADTGLAIGSGEHVHGVAIQLGTARPEVAGIVTTSSGRPETNCIVVLFAADESKWHSAIDRYVRVTRSTADGRYTIGGLPTGDYFAVAVDHIETEASTDPAVLTRLRASGVKLRISDTQPRTFNLNLTKLSDPAGSTSSAPRSPLGMIHIPWSGSHRYATGTDRPTYR